MDLVEIYVDNDSNERIDYYLSQEMEGDISRTYISKLIKEGLVLVNGRKVKPRYLVEKGDFIQIKLPKPKILEVIPENIPINIIYEDQDLLVINKQKGMVVHPDVNNPTGTLANALLYHIDNLSSVGGSLRPGIVHRLDKDTSGILMVAKNNEVHRNLTKQLAEHKVKRVYVALVHGQPNIKEAIINAPIGRDLSNRTRMAVVYKNSKEAITDYKVLREYKDYSLLEVYLHTGRTHQIRVHLSYIGHPIVGDPVYSNIKNKFNINNQLLHAKKIGFYHPRSGGYLELEAEMPKEFNNIIKLLEKRNR